MQARRSLDPQRWGDREGEGLIHAYDEENGLGLADLTESEEESARAEGKVYENGNAGGSRKSLSRSQSRGGSRKGSPLPR